MIYIEDREGVFDAPLDKVWELVKAHTTEGSLIHPSAKNLMTNLLNENTFINTWDEEINAQYIQIKMKGTVFYPLGIAFEVKEGPFAGSTYFIYYLPMDNNKTRVVIAGEFKSASIDPTVDDDQRLRSIVLSRFEKMFEEDYAYLKSM